MVMAHFGIAIRLEAHSSISIPLKTGYSCLNAVIHLTVLSEHFRADIHTAVYRLVAEDETPICVDA